VDFAAIRRTIVIAMFSDDELFDRFVLKGGNALELVHQIIDRGSLDIDLSMQEDFEDLEDTQNRIFRALKDRFDSAGFVVFDESFDRRPKELGPDKPENWGGYVVQFKLISNGRAAELNHDVNKMRREAHPLGDNPKRVFKIDISKHEFCETKTEAELDGFTVFVYTPEMCVFEKLRAICQQMPDYQATKGRGRARDFFDIYTTIEKCNIDVADSKNLGLCQSIFSAKDVPTSLIASIPETREFHRPSWAGVEDSIVGEARPFDDYFDFVSNVIVRKLKSLWEE
jgi:predicted nucleotidyltransferase component of viral defense system